MLNVQVNNNFKLFIVSLLLEHFRIMDEEKARENTFPLAPMTIGAGSKEKTAKGKIFTSNYRGVYCRSGKWNAQIQFNGKKIVK